MDCLQARMRTPEEPPEATAAAAAAPAAAAAAAHATQRSYEVRTLS